MSTRAVPSVPPRPAGSSKSKAEPSSSGDAPKIPPRPARRPERSSSPGRDSYAPSPLNAPPNGGGLGRTTSHGSGSLEQSDRSASVNAPIVGQEGTDNGSLEQAQSSGADDEEQPRVQQPAETRNVTHDLHLHAPRPSLPSETARRQVRAVTRTTSQQAVEAGVGKATSSELGASDLTKEQTNESRQGSSVTSTERRRESLHALGDEHGIPEIGQRVPMDPSAGDVQAPSPAPLGETDSPSKRRGRNQSRTRNDRESSLPPDSYGLHGHGAQPQDKLEKDWYEKHPEELAREEQGQYGPGLGSPRPEWVMNSDELNNIVRSSANKGSGLGTSSEFMGTPEEEVGYIASEELANRLASPSACPAKSPLQQTSVPETDKDEEQNNDHTANEEVEIHIDEPLHRQHHPDGFAPATGEHTLQEATEMHGNEEDKEEAPILAADEADPTGEHAQAAISPTFERRSSSHGPEQDDRRPSSATRNLASPKQMSSSRVTTADAKADDNEDIPTRLEDVEEYEPLFTDDGQAASEERFKRPTGPLRHRFPSKDVWEDAPNSLQLEATVTTPDIQKEPKEHGFAESVKEDIDPTKLVQRKKSSADETPTQLPAGLEEKPKSPEVPAKPVIPARPVKRPSQPSPEDARENTTGPSPEAQKPLVAPGPKPQVPARPSRSRKAEPEGEFLTRTASGSSEEQPEATTTKPAVKPKPAIPARPAGSKISNLKTGFLSDLNDRLKLGPKPPPAPQKEKKEDTETPAAEKGPLSDARKGRARGPARRKPAVRPVSEPEAKSATADAPAIKLVESWSVWQIAEDGALIVQEGMAETNKAASGGGKSIPTLTTETTSSSEVTREPEKSTSSSGGKNEVGRESIDVPEAAAETISPGEIEVTQEPEQLSTSAEEAASGPSDERKDTSKSQDVDEPRHESQSSAIEVQQSAVSNAGTPSEDQEPPNAEEAAEKPQSPELDPATVAAPEGALEQAVSIDEEDKAATSVP